LFPKQICLKHSLSQVLMLHILQSTCFRKHNREWWICFCNRAFWKLFLCYNGPVSMLQSLMTLRKEIKMWKVWVVWMVRKN